MYYLRAPDVETRQKWVAGLEAVKVSICQISSMGDILLCAVVKCFWVLLRNCLKYRWILLA